MTNDMIFYATVAVVIMAMAVNCFRMYCKLDLLETSNNALREMLAHERKMKVAYIELSDDWERLAFEVNEAYEKQKAKYIELAKYVLTLPKGDYPKYPIGDNYPSSDKTV